jgi:hypothetical protein
MNGRNGKKKVAAKKEEEINSIKFALTNLIYLQLMI